MPARRVRFLPGARAPFLLPRDAARTLSALMYARATGLKRRRALTRSKKKKRRGYTRVRVITVLKNKKQHLEHPRTLLRAFTIRDKKNNTYNSYTKKKRARYFSVFFSLRNLYIYIYINYPSSIANLCVLYPGGRQTTRKRLGSEGLEKNIATRRSRTPLNDTGWFFGIDPAASR